MNGHLSVGLPFAKYRSRRNVIIVPHNLEKQAAHNQQSPPGGDNAISINPFTTSLVRTLSKCTGNGDKTYPNVVL